jgi:hypothetical protein
MSGNYKKRAEVAKGLHEDSCQGIGPDRWHSELDRRRPRSMDVRYCYTRYGIAEARARRARC